MTDTSADPPRPFPAGGRSPLWDAELVGGPDRREVVLVEHTEGWAAQFERHAAAIARAVGHRARRIDHVGSTAVPGLCAKPVVDIQVSVGDVEDEAAYVPVLERAGYLLHVREREHRMLRTPDLAVHVHVCSAGAAWERRHLLFRDWLRHDAGDRELYASVKRRLAAHRWPTMQHYADAKSPVIAAITVRAERWAAERGWEPGDDAR